MSEPKQGSLPLGPRVVYEQPLTERMRTFLRLELLFVQIRHHHKAGSDWDHRLVLEKLMDILSVLGRGDLRSELLKESDRIGKALAPFRDRDDVDTGRLGGILKRIDDIDAALSSSDGRMMRVLKEDEFLAALRNRISIPGGTCRFDLPMLHHWLSRDAEQRQADLDAWLNNLDPLRDALTLLLSLFRESETPRQQRAENGQFLQKLDPNVPCQLVRVTVDRDLAAFPEISGSKHRFTVRFLRGEMTGARPQPLNQDVDFWLTLCRL